MNKINFKLLLIGIGSCLFLSSCPKDEDPDDDSKTEFDQKAMLTQIGNNIILPAYQSLNTDLESLNTSITVFIASPDVSNLSTAQTAFKKAYLSWQSVSMYEFGKAEIILLRSSCNTFPTDTVQIKSNIGTGTYDLNSANNIDAKGFPALDYLLFGIANSNEGIVTLYQNSTYKNYLSAINSAIKNNVADVYNDWLSTSGNYINSFVTNLGTNSGSSVAFLVNQMNYDFETLKNFKIGIPLGKKTLGTPMPEKVEAYFSEYSLSLAIANLESIERTFLGKTTAGSDGLGFDDYLTHVGAKYNGGSLSDAIKNQLSTSISKLKSVSGILAETLISNPASIETAYTELQKTIILLKTDLPSALGVLITYQDNDGD